MPDTPLMSEMISRAAATTPLKDTRPEYGTVAQPHNSAKWPMIAALLGGAGDVITTQMNLARTGGRENNPMLPQNRLGNGLALSGLYAGNALLTKYLNDHGHPAIAKILGYGGGVDGGLSAITNLINMKGQVKE